MTGHALCCSIIVKCTCGRDGSGRAVSQTDAVLEGGVVCAGSQSSLGRAPCHAHIAQDIPMPSVAEWPRIAIIMGHFPRWYVALWRAGHPKRWGGMTPPMI